MTSLNRFLPNQPVPVGKRQFYDCGICGAMHSAAWDGDCRQDNARFDIDQLDQRFGCDGWEEVDMPA